MGKPSRRTEDTGRKTKLSLYKAIKSHPRSLCFVSSDYPEDGVQYSALSRDIHDEVLAPIYHFSSNIAEAGDFSSAHGGPC